MKDMTITYLDGDSLQNIQEPEPTVLVLGYFDGVHVGHQALIAKAREMADQNGWTVSLLTFPETPRLAFERYQPALREQLVSPARRSQLFKKYGVDHLYLTHFTSSFSKQTGQQFLHHYVQAIGAQALVVGFDYHYGSERATVEQLQEEFPGPVLVVDEVQLTGKKVSSTRIREALALGDVPLVNCLLGYDFSTDGLVVHGDARGRTIGFPTANIVTDGLVRLPGDGVYVTDVEVSGKLYRAMTSIGKNETFDGTELRVESHLFDFDQEIYGLPIRIYWRSKIREMVKFDSIESLVTQLERDAKVAREWSTTLS